MVRKSKEDFNFYFNAPKKRLTVFLLLIYYDGEIQCCIWNGKCATKNIN